MNNQLELHRELAHRAKRYETESHDLDSKLRSAEGELAANDVLRDGFKLDKEKVTTFFFFFSLFVYLSIHFIVVLK